ncbi:serine/threonine-protein kinase AtPK2/AtPK19 [Sesamum indicum]|uniref:non-specific serine/threonine protein kinase n=1 Tax=Sesamum indicum TaxID=4182 RepID=A0A6I9TU57_SESIN|nr:serine/threonine-protein kinase AtPK2/AtPK19 [Sesamum indicum]XP_011084802.1 serine/threonine-protein kinase AtPK2/AtPK19 [Sesamum indicum]
MVSSQFSKLAGTNLLKPFNNHMLLSGEAPDVFSFDQVDLDFSDVFGPAPTPTTLPLISEESTNFVVPTAVNDLVYDEPAVVYSRSHSFVGPTTCVNQLSKLGKLTLHERDDPLELVGEVDEDAHENFSESSIEKIISEQSISQADSKSEKPIGLEDFEFLKLVGQGAFGKVYQVRKTGSSEIFAMKVMRKDKIMEKNHAEYMKAERDILTQIDHPFIVQLRYSFQTKYRLYLVLDFVNGGHLFFQLYHQGLFREDLGRIYTAEIVSAVAHLHAHGIMHRDLKPENILLDAEGHAMLTDFGLAKQFDEETRSNSMCGTLEYMAPEIILGKGHDKAADWWSVGILLYEMLTGKPPFVGGNRQKIQQKILKDKLKLPAFLSSDAHSLLKGLLQKDASKRIGSGPRGSDEIKGHKWFKSINWKKLEAREIQPSFLPQVAGKHCVANFDERWTKMPLLDSPASSPKFAENPFKGFSYVRPAGQFLQVN